MRFLHQQHRCHAIFVLQMVIRCQRPAHFLVTHLTTKMAIKQTRLSSFEDQLRDYREKNQEALSTLATFDAEDFASLQMHHLTAAYPEPAEYRDLKNKYNIYLSRLLKKFAQGNERAKP